MYPMPSHADILAFQFSSWYPLFSSHTIKSTIIRPLPAEFTDYLKADGIFVPEGSENAPPISELSDDEDEDDDDDAEPRKRYAFSELDKTIRDFLAINNSAIFPKLNFSSPKDASWLLPASSPLKCTSPADIYLLLKSSDFITHDLDPERVFEGCCDANPNDDNEDKPEYQLELVLRKWYPVDRAREVRCFVRDKRLIGISQRDNNFYEFWNDSKTKERVVAAIQDFWQTDIRDRWTATADYTFDFLLTRDLSKGHIIDFNPYAAKTDPLLFAYDELENLKEIETPELRVIDSKSHPAATQNAPQHQHNMIPFEAVELSVGRDIVDFAQLWKSSVEEASDIGPVR